MKFNEKNKKITVCLMLIMCILIGNVLLSTTASAHNGYLTWANDAKLIGGVGSYGNHVRYFWIHSSAAEEESIIDQVRYEWVNTSSILTTSILIRKIGTQKSSVFDIYKNQIYPSSQGILGESFFFDTSNNDMGVPNADYKWTQIILNTLNFNNLSNFTKRGTISHEFGHCMGLAHSTNPNRVMCTADTREVASPSYADLDTINHLYD